jgi:DNA-binding CsgD family transcriptional regulator
MSVLEASLAQARLGQGQLVMLVGDAGMGKTRTAEQLATLAATEGWRVLWGHCHDEEGAPPYWPWVQAFRTIAAEDIAEGLPAGAEEPTPDVHKLLVTLRGRQPAAAHVASIRPEAARFQLFDAVSTYLERAARHQPILLVLDDLHAADHASLHLLDFVAHGLARTRILIVGTCRSRDSFQRPSLFTALRHGPRQTLPLDGFDRHTVLQLLSDAIGYPPSRALLRSVVELTEGNPFFVLEIASLLMHERAEHEDNAIRLPIPETIKAVIARHLERLSHRTHELLRIAAIFGLHIDHWLLRQIWAQGREEELLEVLDDALCAGVLEEDAAAGRYRFRHALIRQVLYEELPPGVRTRLHAQVAAILEADCGADSEQRASELAYHFGKAQYLLGSEKLLRYARVAGEQSLAAHAYDEAAMHFERALACKKGLSVDAETASLLFGLGCARAATSLRWNRQEAWECLCRACEYYLSVGHTDRAFAAVMQGAITPEAVTGAVDMIERVRAVVASDSCEAGWLLARSAAARYFETANYEEARHSFAQVRSIAHGAGDDPLALRALALETAVEHFALRWQGVLEKSQRVISLARTIDDPHAETHARYRLAYALAYTGRAIEAQPHARANLAEAERLGDEGLLEDAIYVNTALAQLHGDWREAQACSDRGLDLAPHHLALLHLRVLLEFELGETAQGREYLVRLLQASSLAGPYPLRDAYRVVVMPQIALLVDDPIPFETIPLTPTQNPNAMALLAIARGLTAVRGTDVPEAKAALRVLAPKKGMILAPPLVMDRLLGLLNHTVGQLDRAASHHEVAIDFCRGAGYRPELAWACHDYARMLVTRDHKGDRARARALLEEAEQISSDLGMLPLRRRITAIRQGSRAMLDRQPDALSRREVNVIRLIASGKTNQEIGSELFISTHTVAVHVAHILAKTGCKNRAEAAAYAMRTLLPDPPEQK